MPRNVIGAAPYTVRTLDLDRPITIADIAPLFAAASTISLCVRSSNGHEQRGGYFFHINRDGALYHICDFEKSQVSTFDAAQLIRFINHVAGRQFDAEIFNHCQTVVNLRQDQRENGQEA